MFYRSFFSQGVTHTLLITGLLSLVSFNSQAQQGNFAQCLNELTVYAGEQGVSESSQQLINTLQYQSKIIELDRNQPEFMQTFPAYFSKRVNDWRINKGQAMYAKHKAFLAELNAQYGIPGHYLMAFWGLETNYGGYKGDTPTLDALATLACDERRKTFFTQELMLALKLVDRENLNPELMQGSWAGAMGHTQFMPSTYTQYAIDGDGDGKIDLWGSEQDALASAANFLKRLGWKPGLRWGREVKLPEGFDYSLAGKANKRPISDWRELGILNVDDERLPVSDIDATLHIPAGHAGPIFLSYANFKTIMRWNNSEFYAIAVGHLADRIINGAPLSADLPDLPPIPRQEIKAMQLALAQQGYDVGGADGIMGPATRAGLRAFQNKKGLIADGFPSVEVRQQLGMQAN